MDHVRRSIGQVWLSDCEELFSAVVSAALVSFAELLFWELLLAAHPARATTGARIKITELNIELNMNIRQFFLGMEESESIPITA